MIKTININKQSDFIFKTFSELNKQRIISIALPFLSLHSKTAQLSSIGIGCYQCYTLLTTTSDKTTTGNKWIEATLLVSSATLGYFFPIHQLMLSNGMFFATHLYQLIKDDTWYKRSTTLLQITHQAIYISSIYYGTPAWIVLSLISQATSELIQAYKEGKDNKKPEMIASLLLAAIRLYTASTYLPKAKGSQPIKESSSQELPTIHEKTTALVDEKDPITPAILPPQEALEPPLKKLTQRDLEKLQSKIAALNNGKPVDIKALLTHEGFSHELEKLSLGSFYGQYIFQGLKFINCNFQYAHFYKSTFDQVTFNNCNFERSTWRGVVVENSQFVNCDFSKSCFKQHENNIDNQLHNLNFIDCNFYKARFDHTHMSLIKAVKTSFIEAYFHTCGITNSFFNECKFVSSILIKSVINNTSLSQCDLTQANWIQCYLNLLDICKGKLTEISFLQTSVTQSQLIDCDLNNAMLLDVKEGFSIQGGTPHHLTKPIIALGRDFKDPGDYEKRTTSVLREHGMLVLHYSNDEIHPSLDKALLNAEIKNHYKKITSNEQSIAQQLLQNDDQNPHVLQLKKTAAEILKHTDGYIIPGGEDIEFSFYKLFEKPKFSYRSLLEIALLSEANQRKVPTMGICRGAQMINIFFGGTLHRHVRGEHGIHELEWTNILKGKRLRQKLGEHFRAESNHHQAVDQVGQGLHVVLKRGTIPKLLLSEDGNFIASQIHPESYIEEQKFLQAYKQPITTQPITGKILTILAKVLKFALPENFSEPEKLAKELVEFVNTNKSIYRFFLKKVEHFRSKMIPLSSQSSAEAG